MLLSINQKLNQLTSVVEKFVNKQISFNAKLTKSCGICLNLGHYTDICPMLQEEKCNAIGGFNQHSQFQDWNNQQDFNYSTAQQSYQAQFSRSPVFQKSQQFQQMPPPQQQSSSDQMKEIREMMKALITNESQFQQETRSGMKTMENQIGQLTTSLCRLEAQISNKIHSQFQPQNHPNIQNVSAINLRSGEELPSTPSKNTINIEPKDDEKNHTKIPPPSSTKPPIVNLQPPPFPERVAKSKKEEEEKEMCSNRKKLKGVVEDVLVKENELVFPTDFYILDMNDDSSLNPTLILLERPFLKTAITNIDIYARALIRKARGDIIQFSLFDTMKYPFDPG